MSGESQKGGGFELVGRKADPCFGEISVLEDSSSGKRVLKKEFRSGNAKLFETLLPRLEEIERRPETHLARLIDFGMDSDEEGSNILKLFFEDTGPSMAEKGEFSHVELTIVMYNVLEALSQLNKEKSCHGRVTPRAISFSQTRRIATLLSTYDLFATPKKLLELYSQLVTSGRPHFLSPGVFEKLLASQNDFEFSPAKEDVWGLGLTLLELGTARPISALYGSAGFDFDGLKKQIDELQNKFEGENSLLPSAVSVMLNLDEAERPTAEEVYSGLIPFEEVIAFLNSTSKPQNSAPSDSQIKSQPQQPRSNNFSQGDQQKNSESYQAEQQKNLTLTQVEPLGTQTVSQIESQKNHTSTHEEQQIKETSSQIHQPKNQTSSQVESQKIPTIILGNQQESQTFSQIDQQRSQTYSQVDQQRNQNFDQVNQLGSPTFSQLDQQKKTHTFPQEDYQRSQNNPEGDQKKTQTCPQENQQTIQSNFQQEQKKGELKLDSNASGELNRGEEPFSFSNTSTGGRVESTRLQQGNQAVVLQPTITASPYRASPTHPSSLATKPPIIVSKPTPASIPTPLLTSNLAPAPASVPVPAPTPIPTIAPTSTPTLISTSSRPGSTAFIDAKFAPLPGPRILHANSSPIEPQQISFAAPPAPTFLGTTRPLGAGQSYQTFVPYQSYQPAPRIEVHTTSFTPKAQHFSYATAFAPRSHTPISSYRTLHPSIQSPLPSYHIHHQPSLIPLPQEVRYIPSFPRGSVERLSIPPVFAHGPVERLSIPPVFARGSVGGLSIPPAFAPLYQHASVYHYPQISVSNYGSEYREPMVLPRGSLPGPQPFYPDPIYYSSYPRIL